ncbi:hypothetical protein E2C01_018032 [Portunus trituberculatus]|uniref:Uncharacterized protein n=1 Tax=Portunus trituberculatus TaxID=210409 RepID=A0A5B7DV50_PORTR|nr:hypothetical protein [Portunus trituberculatus]
MFYGWREATTTTTITTTERGWSGLCHAVCGEMSRLTLRRGFHEPGYNAPASYIRVNTNTLWLDNVLAV